VRDLLDRAAKRFMEEEVDVCGVKLGPEEFVTLVSAATGTPHTIVQEGMRRCFKALFRSLDRIEKLAQHAGFLDSLDVLWTEGSLKNFILHQVFLGAVLPSNAFGTHSLWLAPIPLLRALVLKSGSREILGVLRLCGALIQEGYPAECIGFYPGDHSAAGGVSA